MIEKAKAKLEELKMILGDMPVEDFIEEYGGEEEADMEDEGEMPMMEEGEDMEEEMPMKKKAPDAAKVALIIAKMKKAKGE